MAFHYELPAELSSDEEGGAPLDLSTWKNGGPNTTTSRKPQAPAPTAPMLAFNDYDSDEELTADPLESFQKSNMRCSNGTTTPAPVARTESGFTSINRPSVSFAATAVDDDDAIEMPEFDANNIPVGDEDDVEDDDDEDEIVVQVPKPLVPILPRDELDEDDVVDMTAGWDEVRRVLEELEGDDGTMVYRVELGDYSVEEVRCAISSIFFIFLESMCGSPMCCLCAIRPAYERRASVFCD